MFSLDYIQNEYDLDLNSKMPINIPNVNREDLAVLFGELGFKVGAEIGTEKGVYAEMLCEANPELTLYCIDPWQRYGTYVDHVSQDKLDEFYHITRKRMEPYDCRLIREFSVEAAKVFRHKTLDFVYIDANHNLQNVINDIYAWLPKIKTGGIISGHDFIKRKHAKYQCHVVEAVTAYTQSHHIRPWFVFGSKHPQLNERRDRQRSWLWVKT
jgi:predicted O-methyltransferase YrrM